MTAVKKLKSYEGGRARESLTLQPLAYIVYDYKRRDSWINTIGEAALATWQQLTTMVDRSKTANSKYHNLYTVPFSLKRTAELLGMSANKFNKRIRTLWNAGLVDFAEWEAQSRNGQQVLNLIVYPYPYGDEYYKDKPLPMERDYDKDYISPARSYRKEGMKKAAKIAKQAEIFNQAPGDYVNEFEAPPIDEQLDYSIYDEFMSAYYAPSDEPTIAFPEVTAIPETKQPAIAKTEYPGIAKTEYINIYNTSFNSSNAQINKSNTVNNANTDKLKTPTSFISSSSVNVSEVKKDEELKNVNPSVNDSRFAIVNDLVQIILEDRHVSQRRIDDVINEMNEAGIEICDPEIINKQLDLMSEQENDGKRFFKYGKYFTNGVMDMLENQLHLQKNNFGENSDRRMQQFIQTPDFAANEQVKTKVVKFYNWLDEREG